VVSVDWAGGAASAGFLDTLSNGLYFINLGKNLSGFLKSQGFISRENVNWVGHSWGTLIGFETARNFGGVDRFIALDPATAAGFYNDRLVDFSNFTPKTGPSVIVSLRSTSVKGGGPAEGTFGSEAKAKTCDFAIRLYSNTHTGDVRGPSFYHSLPRDWFIRAMRQHTSDVYWPFFHGKLLRSQVKPGMPWGTDYGRISGFDVECHGSTINKNGSSVFAWHEFLKYKNAKGKVFEARAAKKQDGTLKWSYK